MTIFALVCLAIGTTMIGVSEVAMRRDNLPHWWTVDLIYASWLPLAISALAFAT